MTSIERSCKMKENNYNSCLSVNVKILYCNNVWVNSNILDFVFLFFPLLIIVKKCVRTLEDEMYKKNYYKKICSSQIILKISEIILYYTQLVPIISFLSFILQKTSSHDTVSLNHSERFTPWTLLYCTGYCTLVRTIVYSTLVPCMPS